MYLKKNRAGEIAEWIIFTRSSCSRKCEIMWYLSSANGFCGGCGNKKLTEAQPLFHKAMPSFGPAL
jgi:hypothetical protein